MDVGIRELKRRLSELIERAAAGETIRVTDRGRPKAIITPIPGALDLQEAVGQGWLTEGEQTEPRNNRRRHSARATIAEVMTEDRSA